MTYVHDRLHLNVASRMNMGKSPRDSLHEAFIKTNLEWKAEAEKKFSNDGGGSTAVVVLTNKTGLLASWAGDSSAVIFHNDGTFSQLAQPHKPSNDVCFEFVALRHQCVERTETNRNDGWIYTM